MELFGINWIGATPENGKKLLFSIIFTTAILLIGKINRAAPGLILNSGKCDSMQTEFRPRQDVGLEPGMVCRFDSNCLRMTGFIVLTHKIRTVKDFMSKQILYGLSNAQIRITSSTYDIVGFPPIEINSGKL